MNKRKKIQLILVLAAAMLFFAACTKKKKSDEFQSFGGVSYNAAPKTIAGVLGLTIAVQPMDINFDGTVDGLYICRSGGVRKFTQVTPGSSYVNSPVVNLNTTGCTTQPAVHAVVAGGKVERVQIVNPGAGCTSVALATPSISGGTGTGASAYVTGFSGGRLTRITMVNKGAGYQAPTVTISGGGGSGMTAGVNVGNNGAGPSGQVSGVYLINPGDGLYSTTPTLAISGAGGTGADYQVNPAAVPADFIATELQPNGTCQVSYDPTNANPDARHIPQMLFTWPVTPTLGLDVNGDGNADYYMYTDTDGSSQIMTNSDGSGASAKLIVKNPQIDQTNDYLYDKLIYGQVIGFDILNNNTLANNILGKIALDREDAAYANSADPIAVISPIRNDEAYSSPVDVNVICSDSVACNAITYSLSNTGVPPITPDFGGSNIDPTGSNFTGTLHAIKVGDSGTIPFQSLPYGVYWMKYLVRDAAGRIASGGTFNCVKWDTTTSQWRYYDNSVSATGPNNCVYFSIGAKPVVTISGVANRYTSQPAATTAQIQWYAEIAGGLSFRYIVIRGSCYGHPRSDWFPPYPANTLAAMPTATGGLSSGTTVTTNIKAYESTMDPLYATIVPPLYQLDNNDNVDHGTNYVTICAITCTNPACNGPNQVSVWGDAYETVIRDDTPPTITASPLSGIFTTAQRVWLSGSVTTGSSPNNGPLLPVEICYTWGADAAGNPLAATTPANPSFPCASNNWTVSSTSGGAELNVGCAMRSDVTNLAVDPNTCTFTPGIYYIKYIARDAAGNVTPVQLQTYAVGVTPNITTITPTLDHVWGATTPVVVPPHDWGHTANGPNAAGINTRLTTTWGWQSDFPGFYEIRINSTNCIDGTLSTGGFASGTAAPLTTINSVVQAVDMAVQLNDVKVCLWASGTPGVGTPTSASRSVWKLQPLYINASYALTKFNVGDTIDLYLSDIFTPINSVRTITFSCPAGSTGVDANSACTLPTATGAVVNGTVVDKYTFPNIPAGRVTTLAFDVTITTCSTAGGCVAASGPSWTSGANSGTTTVKVMILQDKTPNNSIFLNDVLGADAYNGLTPDTPKKSFAAAAGLVTASRNAIYATSGTYCAAGVSPCANGTLTIPSGASLYGGFSATTWYRPNVTPVTGSNVTILDGGTSAAGVNSIGTTIGAINSPVRIDGVRITAKQATPSGGVHYNTVALRATAGTSALTLFKAEITATGAACATTGQTNPGGGSYGFYSSGFTGSLTLTSNRIAAGCGYPGIPGGGGGALGGNGTNGNNGTGGIAGCSICGNNSTWRAPGGAGGNGSLGAFNRGGNGGSGGQQEDGSNGTAGVAQAGDWGQAGPNGGGAAGGPGMNEACTNSDNGGGGGAGGTGGTGGNGAAPGAAFGQLTGGYLAAYVGNWGADGGNGMGGGGGGGGAGTEICLNDGGGGGGGGGGGATMGTGGEGGYGGGPSISIYLSAVGSATLTSNTFVRSSAGNAGAGKNGGGGGTAGSPGSGASRANDGGAGGNGGSGGNGGAGGHGSGGNGGSSIGFVLFSTPIGSITCGGGNTYSGGSAGSGGTSAGTAGTAGYLSSNGATNQGFRFGTATTGAAFTCN